MHCLHHIRFRFLSVSRFFSASFATAYAENKRNFPASLFQLKRTLSTEDTNTPCVAYALTSSTMNGNQLCRRRRFSVYNKFK